jgi:hypothetical protein
MRQLAQEQKKVPDRTVFWAIVGIISVFVVVLATVMILRGNTTGQTVRQFFSPSQPFQANPFACLDVPQCGSDISYMCCAEQPLSNRMKCTAPVRGWDASMPRCPADMPYKCSCPEKFIYRQTWPVPSR